MLLLKISMVVVLLSKVFGRWCWCLFFIKLPHSILPNAFKCQYIRYYCSRECVDKTRLLLLSRMC